MIKFVPGFLHRNNVPMLNYSTIARVFGVMALILFLNTETFAQSKTVTGTVTSAADNVPIPGVNVVVKGTSTGTISNVDGQFTISAADADVLVFSFIGYLNEEVEVAGKTTINVSLVEDIEQLDEVVIIGYGVQKKKLLTGATSNVRGEDLQQRNSTSPLQALQGQTAGVNITSTSGQPGKGMKVAIRGVGTIGDASPLYIVDGVTVGNIDYLNPSDIESIDVLKDGASAAIYGSRAANGVILITTKKGEAGRSQITFDAYYGVQNVAKTVELLDATQYAKVMNQQFINSGGSPSSQPFNIANLPYYTTSGKNANTNWLDEMFATNAITQNYVIGASGGSEKSSYSMSVSYTGQEGIVGGADLSNYDRFNARFNSESKLYNDRVRIGENFTFGNVTSKGISDGNIYGNSLRGAFSVTPLMPVYQSDGEFFNNANTANIDQFGKRLAADGQSNPYAAMVYGNQNQTKSNSFVGNVFADIDIIKNLKFRTSFGIDHSSSEYRSYKPVYELSKYTFSDYSEVNQNMSRHFKYMMDNVLTYSNSVDLHKFDLMAGQSLESYKGTYLSGKNTYCSFSDFEHAYLDNCTNIEGSPLMGTNGYPYDDGKILSYFGRVQYAFNETYLFNATLRADGSSKFAPENRWGYFPSVSAGWVVSNEAFMGGITNVMQFFKLRASYGQNGNQNASAFQYLAPIKFTQATYPFGDGEGQQTPGSYPSQLANPELKWETAIQTNIGFDARFLQSKLNVNFDYYHKNQKDWLIKAPVIATAGTDAPWINGGNILNTGVELALGYNNSVGNFNYSVNANGAFNKNKVTEIPTSDGIIHGATNTLYNNAEEFYRAETGHAVGYFWGYELAGIFKSDTEVANYKNSEGKIIQPKAKAGDCKYVDQNGDGIIDINDKVDLGNPIPDFTYGLSVSCSYKAFDFYLMANGAAGHQIVQSYRDHGDKYANYTTAILDAWSTTNPNGTLPRVTNENINYLFSSLFVKDADYLRISTLTIGYDLAKVVKLKNLGQCRFYASVQNLYTFTKYDGMDPEVGYGLDNGDSDKFSSGIDLGYYPRPRTIMLGVNVKF